MQQASIDIKQNSTINDKINIFFHSKLKEKIGIRNYIRNFQDVFFLAVDKTTFGIICNNIDDAKNIYERFGLKINNLIISIWKNKNIKQKYYYRNQENIIEIKMESEFVEKIEHEVVNFDDKNNKQTFENFISAEENKTAFELCKSIACASKNELVNAGSIVLLYGETSTGKTHLLNAISNFYQQLGGKVCCLTSVNFLQKYVDAVKKQDCFSFQDKILQNDIILIDNIDNLFGKNGTLLALKQLLYFAVEQQKYIVLTSRFNVNKLSTSSNIFKTILSNAISLELKAPNNETKTRILMKYITEYNKNLSILLAKSLVEQSNCNVCELKNYIKKLSIIQKVKQFEISPALAHSILKDEIGNNNNHNNHNIHSNEQIIECVAKFYKFKAEDLTSKIKTSNVCLARNIAMFLMRDLNSSNFQEIGRILNRNHSTIISGIKNIENLLDNDKQLPSIIAEIKDIIAKQ